MMKGETFFVPFWQMCYHSMLASIDAIPDERLLTRKEQKALKLKTTKRLRKQRRRLRKLQAA